VTSTCAISYSTKISISSRQTSRRWLNLVTGMFYLMVASRTFQILPTSSSWWSRRRENGPSRSRICNLLHYDGAWSFADLDSDKDGEEGFETANFRSISRCVVQLRANARRKSTAVLRKLLTISKLFRSNIALSWSLMTWSQRCDCWCTKSRMKWRRGLACWWGSSKCLWFEERLYLMNRLA
jgi:hypothetical protein